MSINSLYVFALFFTLINCTPKSKNEGIAEPPNIIILYADDLGYGDLGCYGAAINTPNIDNLAKNGRRFTDAHSAASTCSPSRYALLTGNHAFRRNVAILDGNSPLLIREETSTIASMLQQQGYRTGVVGKWHLGLGNGNKVDWNGDIKPGPLEIGFDYSFIIPITGDRLPTVLMENYGVVGLTQTDSLFVHFVDDPTTLKNPFDEPDGLQNPSMTKQPADSQHSGTIVNSISRVGYMGGGHAARYVDEELSYVLTDKAMEFMEASKENPFLLYFPFHDIHVPRLPNAKFVGATNMGPRGDAIVQMDWMVGKIMEKLKELKLEENTLIIFSSDNGPVLYDGYDDRSLELLGAHKPAGAFSGGKYSILEGGNRVPTITHWPGRIVPGVSDALWSQVDIFASLAQLLNIELESNEAVDSQNVLDVILGTSNQGDPFILEEVYTLALKEDDWKYIVPEDPDAYSWIGEHRNIRSGLSLQPQLFNLHTDSAETKNLFEVYPERGKRMDSIIRTVQQRTLRN